MKGFNVNFNVKIVIICFILLILLFNFHSLITLVNREMSQQPIELNERLKLKFNEIYNTFLWTSAGGGSGPGSTLEYTKTTRDIIYTVVNKYKINSILDSPCGAMVWMPELLKNLTATNRRFKYHGLDIVESVLNKSRVKYADTYKNWRFSVGDMTRGNLPSNYDLILSRDALQHLPLISIYEALRSFAYAPNARYLLVGSYMNSNRNQNITVGQYFENNLSLLPFNLTHMEEYKEVDNIKFLVLYDIPNYLRKVNFEKMKNDILSFN